ncbi:unnamed protein product [Caenorhabditis sp. 36 PRJEB53466]|nr:unnamed protein product [Caenorhabditis sp. 36 PRJEB53466]
MSGEATSSESDNLRRSKRKKFCLDVVAAAHGNNQKKSRRDPHADENDDDDFAFEQQLSVLTEDMSAVREDQSEDYDGEEETLSKRRTRRSTAHWGDYQDTLVDWVDQSGSFACSKCPSRYESRSSLSNHSKMHNGEKRKFACELCDFSASTQKSLMHHNNVHKRYGVVSAQTSPAINASTDTSLNNSTNNNSSNGAPQLVAALSEPYLHAEAEVDAVGSPSETPPPILEREVSPPPLLQREQSSSPLSRHSSDESDAQPNFVPIRKSTRPLKPAKKATPPQTPKKMDKAPKKMRAKLRPLILSSVPNGSLPNSVTPSTSSSVTPPLKSSPAPTKNRNSSKASKKQKQKSEEPEKLERMESPVELQPEEMQERPESLEPQDPFPAKKKRKRRRCPRCPFTATSITRLNRHSGGHRLAEGFVCPAENCDYMCRAAGFLQRHYTVHEGTLPWPPKFVRRSLLSKPTKKSLLVKAQIRSHKKVPSQSGPDVVKKQCNVDGCQFQTSSMTQFIIHKAKVHKAKSAFSNFPFLCITCGHRAKTYAALRVHKLTKHISTASRYHRTYYLKELVGDKYFIKYYTAKTEEEEGEESADESFDSINGSIVPPGALAEIEKKAVFCCNLCPYQAPTMSRCQRHHAKHFTISQFKCRHCSWSSRSKDVLANHEKLHAGPEETSPAEIGQSTVADVPTTASGGAAETAQISETASTAMEMYKCSATTTLGDALKKWCKTAKAARPDFDEHFTRKMIDGQKGFQCIDCPYTSKYRGDMRSHKKRHDIEQMYRCVQCTYTTNRPVSLKDHMKQHLPVNASLQEVKPMRVVVNQGVHIGTRRGIGKERIYCCNKCPYVSLALGCLWRHHRNHRTTAKFYICSNCSYSSIEMRKMEEHTVIHTALGLNESMPFVKRVDQEGNPVSSLTDLNSDKTTERKGKRKLLLDEKKEKEAKPKVEKKRKRSNESTPSSESPNAQPTRPLSERSTKNKINYSMMVKNGNGKPTPSTSAANLEKLNDSCVEDNDEPTEVAHWKIRNFLKKELTIKASRQCPDCPFNNSDADIFEQHLYFHQPQLPLPRPYTCTDCSFNTFTPTAILQHLKLHSEGVYFDPSMKRSIKLRKSETIPHGVKGYYCKNCNYKTPNNRNFVEHCALHRHQLISRINVTMKRQPPKEEYQRPKMKHQFVARNAKYCKKCTFKCVSQSSYVEHIDRHGWNQLYTCHLCDYSDNNKLVVHFHQLNHHAMRDQSLHTVNSATIFRLEDGVIQTPKPAHLKPTPEEFAKKSRGLMKCGLCEYFCHVPSELGFHMSVTHKNEPGAAEAIDYLYMDRIPPQSNITKF